MAGKKLAILEIGLIFFPSMDEYSDYSCDQTYSDMIPAELFDELRQFLFEQSRDHADHPALSNMLDDQPWGFLSLIGKKERWRSDQGEVSILRYKQRIVGVSCVEHGELHGDLSIGGIRCWLDSSHRTRNLMSIFLLDRNLEWSRRQGKLGMLLTFNQYNKWLYDAASRISRGRAGGVGNVWSGWWKDTIPIDRPINVRNVRQWCLCKPIHDGTELRSAMNELESNDDVSSI